MYITNKDCTAVKTFMKNTGARNEIYVMDEKF